jgi:hypothetical protein
MPRGEWVSTRVTGLNAVVRALLTLGLEVEDLKDAFSDIAQTGAELASRYAPRRSGALAGDVRGNRARNKAVITAGRVSVPYAGVINFGWAARGIEASGFMQKADAELQPQALRLLEQSINDSIKQRGLA